MNSLIFATIDITPEQWTDFVKTAGIPPPTGSDEDPRAPYILVHSPSQQTLERTQKIEEPVHSKFSTSPTWDELKSAFTNLSSTDPRHIHPIVFLILDHQSFEDRSVVIIQKGAEFVNTDGEKRHPLPDNEKDLTQMVVWRKYRAPFEAAWTVQCGIDGFCGMEKAEKHFVEEVQREVDAGDAEDE